MFPDLKWSDFEIPTVVFFFFQNSTLDFCVESFIPENDIIKVPTFDENFEKFRTKFSCISIPTKNLDNFDSHAYLEVKKNI